MGDIATLQCGELSWCFIPAPGSRRVAYNGRAMLRSLIFSLLITMSLSAEVKIEKAAYAGWQNCYRVTNGEVELIVTSDVGPRVMRYGFVGGQNLFKEFRDELGKSGEAKWTPRGGHRLWVGPEDEKASYALDNGPVAIHVRQGELEAVQPVEKETGMQKTIIVRLAPSGSSVEVIHRLKNTTLFPVELVPWALTMMAQGGQAIYGFPPRGTHPEMLQPTNPLVMWAYTNFGDPRWKFTSKYLGLRQDPKATNPQKTAFFNVNTWGAYLLNGDLFIKRYTADPTRTYPDMGVSFETFTNADFLELETIGPMTKLAPGATVEHVERWSLHKGVKLAEFSDAELDRAVKPLL